MYIADLDAPPAISGDKLGNAQQALRGRHRSIRLERPTLDGVMYAHGDAGLFHQRIQYVGRRAVIASNSRRHHRSQMRCSGRHLFEA
ncbi:hypothetical protein AW168_35440 [Nocardia brasiliensis]|nr:hypothetical protein AW168_35440 [Nocardia brasiliensis]